MPSGLDGNADPSTSARRRGVLEDVGARVRSRRRDGHVVRVAIDGIDGAGKSTFADEVARVLRRRGVPVVRATTDSFHHPRSIRWSRGPLSPEGFYRDSHDLARLRAVLLDPLTSEPPQPYRAATFDEPTDAPVDAPVETVGPGAVLVFDGLFLHRPELRRYWDLSIWLDGERRVTAQRIARASSQIGPGPEGLVSLAWWCAVLGRYVGGMALYIDECRPQLEADAVVGNDDFLNPTLTWRQA